MTDDKGVELLRGRLEQLIKGWFGESPSKPSLEVLIRLYGADPRNEFLPSTADYFIEELRKKAIRDAVSALNATGQLQSVWREIIGNFIASIFPPPQPNTLLDAVPQMSQDQKRIRKLGLALSGGGFRASFFHLGVLRRLAELDLLRDVSVISAVSGGSIVAAHYYLHLKEELQVGSTPDYVQLVKRLESEFSKGVSYDLRTRLVLNPLRNLAMLCLGRSLGQLMARLYTKYLYREVIRRTFPNSAWIRGVPLWKPFIEFERSDREMRPHNQSQFPVGIRGDLEGYNNNAPDPIPRIPKLVLNSTCLNTGREFRFTIAEIGDPQLGYIRFDEIYLVLQYKLLLSVVDTVGGTCNDAYKIAVRKIKNGYFAKVGSMHAQPAIGAIEELITPAYRPFAPDHLFWWLAVDSAMNGGHDAFRKFIGIQSQEPLRMMLDYLSAHPMVGENPVVVYLFQNEDDSRRLRAAERGILRQAKLAAWYLVVGSRRELHGGCTREQHVQRLWDAIDDIDPNMAERLKEQFGPTSKYKNDSAFYEFVMDLYYFQSAVAFSWTVPQEVEWLTLSDAVAASANFPPVFPPFVIHDLYDQDHAQILGLTDGGVYENQGLTALFDEECSHIIASDAGGIMGAEARPASGRGAMMVRIVDVLTANLRDWQLLSLRERRRVTAALDSVPKASSTEINELRLQNQLQAVAFFHMTTNPNEAEPTGASSLPSHPDAEKIAKLRTDLDAFTETERNALIYQGYQLADRFVRKWFDAPLRAKWGANIPQPSSPVPQPEPPNTIRGERAARLLTAGHQRFGRLFVLFPSLKWFVLIMLAISVSVVIWDTPLASIISVVDDWMADFVRWPLLVYIIDRRWSTLGTLLVLVLLIVFWWSWGRVEESSSRWLRPWWRREYVGRIIIARGANWPELVRRNLWWLAGLLPIWIALLGSSTALIILHVVDPLLMRLGKRKG